MDLVETLKPGSKHSPLITRLTERFLEMKAGDEISYQAIAYVIQLDVREPLGKSILYSARRRAQSGGVVLENLRGVGYRRQTPGDICREALASDLPAVRRANTRAASKIATVHPLNPELSPEERVQNRAALYLTGAIEQTISPRAIAKTVQLVGTMPSPSPGALLEELKQNS